MESVRGRLGGVAAAALLAGLGSAGVTAGGVAGPGGATCALAADGSRAGLVVEHGDGRTLRLCVAFTGAQATGEQLLEAAHSQYGLEYQTVDYGSMGRALCQLDNEPATPSGGFNSNNCLQGQGGTYWAMFVSRAGAAWTGSTQGISSQPFNDGDAEGFHYGQGPPPSPAGTCPPRQPTPSPAPPSAVPRPTAAARSAAPATAPSGRSGATTPPGEATAPAASPTDWPASPSPGPVTPSPGRSPGRVAAPAGGDGPPAAGILVAAVAALGLGGLLAAQLILPRLRP